VAGGTDGGDAGLVIAMGIGGLVLLRRRRARSLPRRFPA